MKKITFKLLCLTLTCCMICLMFAGCGQAKPETGDQPDAQDATQGITDDTASDNTTDEQAQGENTSLYIGTSKGGFKEYPVQLDGEVTAEKLIAAMADLTGWNLDLSDEVFSGKGGMTVSFAPECALVTGPPETQKEEFVVYDNCGLVQMILDSIQETLRKNFVAEPGDPTSLDIWYCIDEQPIEVEGQVIATDKPWDEQNIFG